MTALLARFRALPRAAQWLVLLGLALAAYFLVIEKILDATQRLNFSADNIARALEREHSSADNWSGPGRPLAAAREAFGEPLLPGPDAQRKQALYTRVNQILDKHRVRPEIAERTATIRDDRADRLRDGADRIDRLTLDLTFETDPATVVAVLTDLEQAPEVTAVSRVQIRRVEAGRTGASHRVRAVLSPETWVRVSPSGGAANGGSRS